MLSKVLSSLLVVGSLVPFVVGDIYLHIPRGSNNRLNGDGQNVDNNNRLFDSQNNNNGGYNVGEGTTGIGSGSMYYYAGSKLFITWTNQHACDNPKVTCEFVIQSLCNDINPDLSDGTTTDTPWSDGMPYGSGPGQQEGWTNFRKCDHRERNGGLFTADQELERDTARSTRQNPAGNRQGYECPEERDYWPYWHPTQWVDEAVLVHRLDMCPTYQAESQNVKEKGECVCGTSNLTPSSGVTITFDNEIEGKQLEVLRGSVTGATPATHTLNCHGLQWAKWTTFGREGLSSPYTYEWNSDGTFACSLFHWEDHGEAYMVSLTPIGVDEPDWSGASINEPYEEFSTTLDGADNPGTLFSVGHTTSTGWYGQEAQAQGTVPLPQCGGPMEDTLFYSCIDMNKDCDAFDYNNQVECEANGFQWQDGRFSATKTNVEPVCELAPWSRDNHLGSGANGYMNTFEWVVPERMVGKECVIRARYNISTGDFDGQSTYVEDNDILSSLDGVVSFDQGENPIVNIGAGTNNLELAVNTAQFGRTFQDRSHVFSVKAWPTDVPTTATIWNVNVRGKRGNIVQVYPAVEYDFSPNILNVDQNDYVHFQWTGSNSNPDGNDGQGTAGTDRNNIVQIETLNDNFPVVYSSGVVQPMFDSVATKRLANAGATDPLLNTGAAYFDGGLVRFSTVSDFYYMCTRNNAFSNRGQKAAIKVVSSGAEDLNNARFLEQNDIIDALNNDGEVGGTDGDGDDFVVPGETKSWFGAALGLGVVAAALGVAVVVLFVLLMRKSNEISETKYSRVHNVVN